MGPSGRPGNAGTDVSEIINVSVWSFCFFKCTAVDEPHQSLFSADFGDENPEVSSWYKKKKTVFVKRRQTIYNSWDSFEGELLHKIASTCKI